MNNKEQNEKEQMAEKISHLKKEIKKLENELQDQNNFDLAKAIKEHQEEQKEAIRILSGVFEEKKLAYLNRFSKEILLTVIKKFLLFGMPPKLDIIFLLQKEADKILEENREAIKKAEIRTLLLEEEGRTREKKEEKEFIYHLIDTGNDLYDCYIKILKALALVSETNIHLAPEKVVPEIVPEEKEEKESNEN